MTPLVEYIDVTMRAVCETPSLPYQHFLFFRGKPLGYYTFMFWVIFQEVILPALYTGKCTRLNVTEINF